MYRAHYIDKLVQYFFLMYSVVVSFIYIFNYVCIITSGLHSQEIILFA